PLLFDRFPFDQRYQSFQLYQRGVMWTTIVKGFKNTFTSKSPKELFDEWQTGFSLSDSVMKQNERTLLEDLKDPHIHYLDLFTGDYDHVAHLTSDRVSQLHVVEELDALVGRVWSAIATSPYPATTALVLVSDHGMNTTEGVYSQGFNFVEWFNSAAGGGHHVLTNRYPLTEFKLKGLNFFVSEVITPSQESSYLADQSAQYPTVMLDLDGNERANIGLRSNTFNRLQVLLEELTQKRIPGPVRGAALSAFFSILDSVRTAWGQDLTELSAQLAALDLKIEMQRKVVDALPRKFTEAQVNAGLDDAAHREVRRLDSWRGERRAYADYAAPVRRLLDLSPADFDPGKFKMEDLIPRKSLGPSNSLWDLQHYTVGPADSGLALNKDGSLDWDHSFRTIDYFSALTSISVRNNLQKDVAPQPVDFIAVRIPRESLSLPQADQPDRDAIWLYRDPEHQALVLARKNGDLRYIPVSHLSASETGPVNFDHASWATGLPLELFEDPQLDVPAAERTAWLDQWHDERTWFNAVHRTRYSNGIIGLTEELLYDKVPSTDIMTEYRDRKRDLRRTDLLVFANNHWNFNVRGFNPGGNHGSFLRNSTHSVLLIAGGKDTGIPHGLRVSTPYDSLSFVPTILTLLGRPEPDLPGPVIREVVPRDSVNNAADGRRSSAPR
ncbi:MAG: alkaline phosphatase family protein, partial [Bryobacteraceae bacterium]